MTTARSLCSVLSLLTLPMAFAAGTAAQTRAPATPWFGLEVPSGLALPPQLAVLDDPSFRAPTATLADGDERHDELEGGRIRRYLEEIVGFSHQSRANGELMWGRVSGFPAAAATAEWLAEQFREAGLRDVRVQRYEADAGAPMWWPAHWEVRLLGNEAFGLGSTDVVLHSAVPTRGSEIPGGILVAPLVYVDDPGAAADVDVRGKIVVHRRKPTGGAFSQRRPIREAAEALFGRGAVAVLNYMDQPGNMGVRDFSGCAHCFNIGGEDGAFLRSVHERAEREGKADELRVRLYLDAGEHSDLTAQNVVGVVPGDSDEIVIVNAHMDGWYDAAGDNGDGLAVQVALARHFARPENRPARTLLFVGSGGHHSTGLNGPGHFVEMNPELAARAVLALNLEHIAQFLVDPETFRLERTEQPMGWGVTNMAPFLLELTDQAVERYDFRLRPEYSTSVAGDLGGYAPLGIPRVQAIHAGPLYHTTGDVLKSISTEGLERAARFYAFWIDGVAKASRQQIDP